MTGSADAAPRTKARSGRRKSQNLGHFSLNATLLLQDLEIQHIGNREGEAPAEPHLARQEPRPPVSPRAVLGGDQRVVSHFCNF